MSLIAELCRTDGEPPTLRSQPLHRSHGRDQYGSVRNRAGVLYVGGLIGSALLGAIGIAYAFNPNTLSIPPEPVGWWLATLAFIGGILLAVTVFSQWQTQGFVRLFFLMVVAGLAAGWIAASVLGVLIEPVRLAAYTGCASLDRACGECRAVLAVAGGSYAKSSGVTWSRNSRNFSTSCSSSSRMTMEASVRTSSLA